MERADFAVLPGKKATDYGLLDWEEAPKWRFNGTVHVNLEFKDDSGREIGTYEDIIEISDI